MFVRKDFLPADPEENEPYAFDFSKDLATGETITDATWSCTVAADSVGTDPTPSARLLLLPQNTATVTTQRVAYMVSGVKYVLQAIVTTSDGNTLSDWAHVTCHEPS